MFRLFSSRCVPRAAGLCRLQPARCFASSLPSSTGNNAPPAGSGSGEEPFLNPDWFRPPQESDGPRCIAPDYPDVPYQSLQARSPYAQWSDPQLRRNLGEPVQEQYDALSTQSFDIEPTYSIRYMLTGLALAAGTFAGLVQLINLFDDKNGWRRDVAERDFPYLHMYQGKPTGPSL